MTVNGDNGTWLLAPHNCVGPRDVSHSHRRWTGWAARIATDALALIASIALTGLATTARGAAPQATGGAVRLGPVLDIPAHTEAGQMSVVRAALGSDGRAHLIVLSHSGTPQDTVYTLSYMTVSWDHVEAEEPIARFGAGQFHGGFAIALDAQNAPTVIVSGLRYSRTSSGWLAPAPAPRCMTLLASGGQFICALLVQGADAGSAPTRWEWESFGAPLAAFVLPQGGAVHKLLLGRASAQGWTDWRIVDRDNAYSATAPALAADAHGGVQVLYVPVGQHRARYAHVEFSGAPIGGGETMAARTASLRHLNMVVGSDVNEVPVSILRGTSLVSLAVDPESTHPLGISMDRQSKAPLQAFSGGTLPGTPLTIAEVGAFKVGSAVAAAAGGDRFHIVCAEQSGTIHQQVALTYRSFSGGALSEPVFVATASRFDQADYGLALWSGGGRSAFLVWHDLATLQLHGRFIELKE